MDVLPTITCNISYIFIVKIFIFKREDWYVNIYKHKYRKSRIIWLIQLSGRIQRWLLWSIVVFVYLSVTPKVCSTNGAVLWEGWCRKVGHPSLCNLRPRLVVRRSGSKKPSQSLGAGTEGSTHSLVGKKLSPIFRRKFVWSVAPKWNWIISCLHHYPRCSEKIHLLRLTKNHSNRIKTVIVVIGEVTGTYKRSTPQFWPRSRHFHRLSSPTVDRNR